jgi:hypothetical protein
LPGGKFLKGNQYFKGNEADQKRDVSMDEKSGEEEEN